MTVLRSALLAAKKEKPQIVFLRFFALMDGLFNLFCVVKENSTYQKSNFITYSI